jgi:hypothetical protein
MARPHPHGRPHGDLRAPIDFGHRTCDRAAATEHAQLGRRTCACGRHGCFGRSHRRRGSERPSGSTPRSESTPCRRRSMRTSNERTSKDAAVCLPYSRSGDSPRRRSQESQHEVDGRGSSCTGREREALVACGTPRDGLAYSGCAGVPTPPLERCLFTKRWMRCLTGSKRAPTTKAAIIEPGKECRCARVTRK